MNQTKHTDFYLQKDILYIIFGADEVTQKKVIQIEITLTK